MKPIVFCAALLAVTCSSAAALERCDHCGCQSCCRKVCRAVPGTKKVTKTTYECECEDFCVPGPSQHCVECDECGKKKHVFTPTCAEVRTRKKLVKKETSKEVPTCKWVVETVCDACVCKCRGEAAPAKDCAPKNPGARNSEGTDDESQPAALPEPPSPPVPPAPLPSSANRVSAGPAGMLHASLQRAIKPLRNTK